MTQATNDYNQPHQPSFDTIIKKFMMAGFGVEAGTQSPDEPPHAVMHRNDIAVKIIQHPDRVSISVQFKFIYEDDKETLESVYN